MRWRQERPETPRRFNESLDTLINPGHHGRALQHYSFVQRGTQGLAQGATLCIHP